MATLRYKLSAIIAAGALILYAFYAKSPGGFLDDVVWPIAYCAIAAATLLTVFRPCRATLRIWAALIISTETLRALSNLTNVSDDEHLARFGIHTKMAILAYFVWVGWRSIVPQRYGDDPI